MQIIALFLLLAIAVMSPAQWKLQNSQSKTDLLSVSTTGGAVWVSGKNGTVLVSDDDGTTWKTCTVPIDGAMLTMQAVQGLSPSTAIVISQGIGEKSRVYRTTDGCDTWKKVFTNPEMASSFDALRRVTDKQLYVIGEPVNGKFTEYLSQNGGETWFIADDPGLDAGIKESAISSPLVASGPFLYFGGSGGSTPVLHFTYAKCAPASKDDCSIAWNASALPGFPNANIRALATRTQTSMSGESRTTILVAGKIGDAALVAQTSDNGAHWSVPASMPSGPIAAIAFDPMTQSWISVGDGGTHISYDGARTWHSAKSGEGNSVDGDWTAVAMPYAVGKKGQIGKFVPSQGKR